MKYHLLPILLFLLAVVSSAETSRNFEPSAIWPDDQENHINAHGGGVLFHEGRYYWFGEHKTEGPTD